MINEFGRDGRRGNERVIFRKVVRKEIECIKDDEKWQSRLSGWYCSRNVIKWGIRIIDWLLRIFNRCMDNDIV